MAASVPLRGFDAPVLDGETIPRSVDGVEQLFIRRFGRFVPGHVDLAGVRTQGTRYFPMFDPSTFSRVGRRVGASLVDPRGRVVTHRPFGVDDASPFFDERFHRRVVRPFGLDVAFHEVVHQMTSRTTWAWARTDTGRRASYGPLFEAATQYLTLEGGIQPTVSSPYDAGARLLTELHLPSELVPHAIFNGRVVELEEHIMKATGVADVGLLHAGFRNLEKGRPFSAPLAEEA